MEHENYFQGNLAVNITVFSFNLQRFPILSILNCEHNRFTWFISHTTLSISSLLRTSIL